MTTMQHRSSTAAAAAAAAASAIVVARWGLVMGRHTDEDDEELPPTEKLK